MHAYSKNLARPTIDALLKNENKIIVILSHKIDQDNYSWLSKNGVQTIYSFKKYGKQFFDEAIVNKKSKAVISILSFTYFLFIKKLWFKNFIVFEGVYPFTFSCCFLSKLNLIHLTYIAHGVHRSDFIFRFQKTILFENVSQNDLKKFHRQFQKTNLAFSTYINTINKLREISENNITGKILHFEKSPDKIALFLGGFESENGCFESDLIEQMYKKLQEIGENIKTKHPEINLIYRVHPSHLTEFYQKTQKNLSPYGWNFSLNNDYLYDLMRASCVFSFDSSGLYEAQDLGIPTMRIEFPEVTHKILEFDLEMTSLKKIMGTNPIVEWIYEMSRLRQDGIITDKNRSENLYRSSMENLNYALLN